MPPKKDEFPVELRMAEKLFGKERVVSWLYRSVMAVALFRILGTTTQTWDMIQKIPSIIQAQEDQKKVLDDHSKNLHDIWDVLHKNKLADSSTHVLP
jgi:hypothetical protein